MRRPDSIFGWVVFLLAGLSSSLMAADFDADGLVDSWQIQYGFPTNGYESTNLVAWWQMDKTTSTNVADRTTNNVTGTLSNFTVFPFVTGLYSNAISFSSNSFANLSTNSGVLTITNHFTISTWYYATNTTKRVDIATWRDTNNNSWIFGVQTNGLPRLLFNNVQNVQVTNAAYNVNNNTWHHLAGVFAKSNSVAVVYVDGIPLASATITNWSPKKVSTFRLGVTNNAVFLLDEARLYKSVISSNGIGQLPATYYDTDGDGRSNLQEYQNGTNPTNKEYQLLLYPQYGGVITGGVNGAFYNSGAVLTLTAIPTNNFGFGYWSGDLTGTNRTQNLTMSATRSVAATFEPLHTTDINHDGKSDIIIQNIDDTQVGVVYQDGLGNVISSEYIQYNGGLPYNIGNFRVFGTADINGDGHADLLLQDAASTYIYVSYLTNQVVTNSAPIATIDLGTWKCVSSGDFNGDGKADVLFQNTTNTLLTVDYFNGATFLSEAAVTTTNIGNWKAVATGRFHDTQKTDIVLQDSATTAIKIWLMDGITKVGESTVTTNIAPWIVVSAGDYNSDGKADIVLQNKDTTQVAFLFMDGTNYLSTFFSSTYGSYRVGGAAGWDIDGDYLPDKWETQYFGSVTNKDGKVDSDGDSTTDLQEFRLGTNPTDKYNGALQLSMYSGNNQLGLTNTFAFLPMIVQAATNGFGVTNYPVVFSMTQGVGKVAVTNGGALFITYTNRTDSNGFATAAIYLGTNTSTNLVTAFLTSGTYTSQVVFSETASFQAPTTNNLVLWLKADAGLTVQTTNGTNFVSKWQDQFTYQNNATQAVASLQPFVVTNAINGRSALRFDGVNDYFSAGDSPSLTYSNLTYYVVASFDTPDSSSRALISKATAQKWIYWYDQGGMTFHIQPGNLNVVSTPFTKSANRYYVFEITKDGSNYAHYINGKFFGATTNGIQIPTPINSDFRIGQAQNTFFLNGCIAEIMVYDKALSGTAQQTAEQYLCEKYGMPLSIATPAISPNGGSYSNSVSVAISTLTINTIIRYTTDGSTPTTASSLYSGVFALTNSTTINARAFRTNSYDSAVATAIFYVNDTDQNGMSDAWEISNFGATGQDPNGDPDSDGLTNIEEFQRGANPNNSDTNGDGVIDGIAVAIGISATNTDLDGDGLINAKELELRTNPLAADTDGDGVIDGSDAFPLDPTRWFAPSPNPADHTAPGINLTEPSNAVLLP